MTIECTIRFKDPRALVRETAHSLSDAYGFEIKGYVMGGFYFLADMSIREILEVVESENFEDAHFENIEFKPV